MASVERSAVYTFHGLAGGRLAGPAALPGRRRRPSDAAVPRPGHVRRTARRRQPGLEAGRRARRVRRRRPARHLPGRARTPCPGGDRRRGGFGQLICLLDPDEACAGDEALLAAHHGESDTPSFIPPLGPGPCVAPAAATCRRSRIDGARLDDLVGPRSPAVHRRTGRPFGARRLVVAGARRRPRRPVDARGGHAARRSGGLRRPARPLRAGPRDRSTRSQRARGPCGSAIRA